MSPSPLIEEEVGEFWSEHEHGLTAFSSQVHVGSDFTDNMFAYQHVACVASLLAMTSEKRFYVIVQRLKGDTTFRINGWQMVVGS